MQVERRHLQVFTCGLSNNRCVVMSGKLFASVLAGVCGTIFLGYCIYFDHKRRSDPQFKQKLRESKLRFCGFIWLVKIKPYRG